MGVTLYLDGAFAAWKGGFKIKYALNGELVAPAPGQTQKIVKVQWPGQWGDVSNASAHKGKLNLRAAITANLSQATAADPMRIAGHSGGGQTIMKMLREDGPALEAELTAAGKGKNVLKFYILGSPEMKFIGTSYLYPDADGADYPGDPAHGGQAHTAGCPTPPEFHGGYGIGYGLPEPCTWYCECVAVQYDGWANAPTNEAGHPDVNKVWNTGLFAKTKSASGPHGDYDKKGFPGLTGGDAFSWYDAANPTVRYSIIRRYPFPAYDTISWMRFLIRNKDMTNRAAIDACYDATDSTHGRQVTVPAPDYTAVATWFPLT
jgi:hypothetical protein